MFILKNYQSHKYFLNTMLLHDPIEALPKLNFVGTACCVNTYPEKTEKQIRSLPNTAVYDTYHLAVQFFYFL